MFFLICLLVFIFNVDLIVAIGWCESMQGHANNIVHDALASDVCLVRFATVQTPRVLKFGGKVLYASSPRVETQGRAPKGLGAVVSLADEDNDGVADSEDSVFLYDRHVHGIHIHNDKFYFTDDDHVWSVPYVAGQHVAATNKCVPPPAFRVLTVTNHCAVEHCRTRR